MSDQPSVPPAGPSRRPADPAVALRGFLLLDAGVRLFFWSTSLALATALMTRWKAWPATPLVGADLAAAWRWGERLTWWVVLFNLIYVALLIVIRLVVPSPRPGKYDMRAGAKLSRQLVWSCLIAVLTKARYEAPFPGFLVFHFANLPPLHWLMSPIFGPRSKSCYVAEPRVLDPNLVTIGRNVVIGFNTTITGHLQDRDSVEISPTVIEDDVLIGGHVAIAGGCHIKSGSMIGMGAMLKPGTVVGPNEFWGGVPARKIRDLPPP